MSETQTAVNLLNKILTTAQVEGAAAVSHNGWLAPKQAAKENPNDPFQGWGPERVRVRELTPEQRQELGIAEGASPGADVYHPLFKPFEELDTDTQGKNVLPLAVLCYGLGDFLLQPGATVQDLATLLDGLLDRSNASAINLLMRLNHVAFQSAEIRVGSRGFGENARDDFPLFMSLHQEVAALDEYTLLPAAQWLREQIRKDYNL
jgi:hypothetical protein